MRFPLLAAVLAATASATLAADTPRLRNARLQSEDAGGLPQATVSRLVAGQREPGFIAYSVSAPRSRGLCCFDCRSGEAGGVVKDACRLEGDNSFTRSGDDEEGPGSDRLVIVIRAEAGEATHVRAYSADCPLDAGQRPVRWLSELGEAASVAILAPLAGSERPRVADGAMHALSAHGGRASVDALISLARNHPTSHTRGQALFWLAQRAGVEAEHAITRAIEDDPETEVKKKAVFALSQLPRDEGVPLLIRTAANNRNPAVRHQAMFWLGQSHDPRALTFFEQVLK